MQTMREFLEAAGGFTMESTPVPENPNMESDMVSGSRHYHVTLRRGDAAMTTYFSVGPGVVEQWARKHAPAPMRARLARVPSRSVDGSAALADAAERYRPAVVDVLDCLASDAASVECARDFQDWAADMGLDADSRRAERTYNLCREQSRRLRDLLGTDLFESLLYDTERE